ncbi:MAG: septal ring lytic transglycosylase RlpA family protein [Melioribacteraceae bacterium]|nr:MAG: septal ring lytic transglycosylase RlpA family protein [Melioribacteraceae bacterium]
MHKKISVKFLFIITILTATACSSVPRFTSENKSQKINTEKPNEIKYENLSSYNNYTVLETVTGLASYYADKYHGRLTSNGEIYNMYGITAAHPTYPHNTIIRVTNLSNNKSTIIRINDRMPQHPNRIIDLSYGTALELDMVEAGVVEVKLEILEWGGEN